MKDEEKSLDGLKVDISLDQGKPIEDSVFTMIEKRYSVVPLPY